MSVTLEFGDDEVVEVPWSLVDDAGAPIVPDTVVVHLDAHSGTTSTGTVTDNGDGTGVWTIDMTALTEHSYHWHFLVSIGDEDRRPKGMYGTLKVVRP